MSENNYATDFVIASTATAVTGQIVSISEEGVPFVDYPGNPCGAMEAQVAVESIVKDGGPWPSVLLIFENGDPTRPIIAGLVRRTIAVESRSRGTRPIRQLLLDAEEEVLLRCGKSSLLLRRDGKIVLKGVRIVSRASGVNKVQGATVQLN
jgi:hypothetical protein